MCLISVFFGSPSNFQVKAMTLICLLLQGILVVMGNRRKYSTSRKLKLVLWLAYQWSAALAKLLMYFLLPKGGISGPKFGLEAYWAPFLLLLRGGSDTITAYSLIDNELWLRQTTDLVVPIGQVIYIIYTTSRKTLLDFMPVLIFIAGLIKNLESLWVRKSASRENFKESVLPDPDAGPNYSRYMEEYRSKKCEGFDVESGKFKEAPIVGDLSFTAPKNLKIADGATIQDAYIFFKNFEQLFADLILHVEDKVMAKSQSFFQNASCSEAFKVIEVELGFLFDIFYTKAFMFYSLKGGLLRILSFFCTVSALLVFLKIDKQAYKTADVITTYILLGGGTMLEICALLVLLKSDWTMLWLSNHSNIVVDLMYGAISLIPWPEKKRWSNTMAQHSLITGCFIKHKKRHCPKVRPKGTKFEHSADVSTDLKKLIFEQLLEKSRSASDFEACKELRAFRGDRVVKNAKCSNCEDKEKQRTHESAEIESDPVLEDARCIYEISKDDRKIVEESVKVEFDQSVLLWHIATSLCDNYDRNTTQNPVICLNHEASKLLSDYMLYLLIDRPFMLPKGIARVRYGETCAEAFNFFEDGKSIFDVNQAYSNILEVNTEVSPREVKGDRSKSVLFDGCRLAKSLQRLNTGKKWELISRVWLEMLCYAANKCRWNDHAKLLCHGGELLTHVSLLMAHLGISEKLKILKGQARPKLSVC